MNKGDPTRHGVPGRPTPTPRPGTRPRTYCANARILRGSPVRAATCFERSIALSRERATRSWELRAARDLARLWAEQGKRQKAYDLLDPVYGWFTEGFEIADLKDAKELLEELA